MKLTEKAVVTALVFLAVFIAVWPSTALLALLLKGAAVTLALAGVWAGGYYTGTTQGMSKVLKRLDEEMESWRMNGERPRLHVQERRKRMIEQGQSDEFSAQGDEGESSEVGA